MNANIDNICNILTNYAHSLKQDAIAKIKNVHPKTNSMSEASPQTKPQSYVSNPERPWMVGGGVVLAIGILGAIFSEESWPYVLGGTGVASIIYGQTKKNKQNGQGHSTSQTDSSISEPKGYEIAEKVIEISKIVENKWRAKVEECKGRVQSAIEASTASTELKDSLIGMTYTTERVTIDFDTVVSRLNTQPVSVFPSILSEYERIVSRCIDKAANDQIAIYSSISKKL